MGRLYRLRLSLAIIALVFVAAATGCGHSISGAEPPSPGPPPPPEYAFVSNTADSVVSSFSLNLSTGVLTFADSVTAGPAGGAMGLAISRKGQFLYVANQLSGEIFGYNINKSNGKLTPTSQGSISTGNGSAPLTMSISGDNILYAIDSANNMVLSYSIGSGGGLKAIGTPVPTGNGPVSILVAPLGTAVFVANSIDSTITGYAIAKNGTLTATGAIGADEPLWLAANPTSSDIYAASAAGLPGGAIADFTVVNGNTLGFVGNFSTGNTSNFPLSLIVNPATPFVYVANGANNNVSKLTVQSSGLSAPSLIPAITTPNSITTDPNGKFLYITDQSEGQIFEGSLDPTTGDFTPLGTPTVPTEQPPNPSSSPFQILTTNASG